MKSSLYLACMAMLVAFGASTLSPTLQKYYCVYNGVFTNRQFVEQNADSGVTLVEVRVSSVVLPNISDRPLTFVLQSDNGQVVMCELGLITEGENGLIEVTPYNFTNCIGKKPDDININDYKDLTRDRLQANPGCGGSMQLVGDSRFEGDLPDCRHVSSSGLRRAYTAVLRCDAIIVGVPRAAAETSPTGEITLNLEGAKFPLPDGSSCVCDNTSG